MDRYNCVFEDVVDVISFCAHAHTTHHGRWEMEDGDESKRIMIWMNKPGSSRVEKVLSRFSCVTNLS